MDTFFKLQPETSLLKMITMPRCKTLFLIITLFNLITMNASSQQPLKNYDSQWKKADDLIKKGLPQSALTEVKKIYAAAKKDKQDAQVIKALVYITELTPEARTDNPVIASIHEIEKEIPLAKEPAVSVLRSLAAQSYWNYLQNNRWKFYQRTNTTGFKKEDIATWTKDDLYKQIGVLYLASLEKEKLLQQTPLSQFDAILVKGNTRKLRPTLYDLLVHRALDFFKNDEHDLTRPAYAFEIAQPEAFAPFTEFSRYHFKTLDSGSLHYKALLLFQDLLTFHSKPQDADALIDADIERLEFVKQYSVHPDKDSLYLAALSNIVTKFPDAPGSDQANYLQAQYYTGLAANYKPYGDTTYHRYYITARTIAEKVNSRKGETEGKINAYNLLKQIEQQELQFTVEKVNVPGEPFRALVSYRNIGQLFLRIIKPDPQLKSQLENVYNEKYWSAILNASALKNWEQALPSTNDFQKHQVEIKIDALPVGEYLLVAGTQKDFDDKKALLGARLVYVSNISYATTGSDFFVLNRDNGQPLSKASVQVWERRYDSKSSKYVKEKGGSYITDANGLVQSKRPSGNSFRENFLLDISYQSDKLFLDDLLYDNYYARGGEEPQPSGTATWLFTDRGIYRPGQTVYVKGIVTTKNNGAVRAGVRANYQTELYLKNANDELIDSLTVTTNDFGSFSGKFQLPQNTLNGGFSLTMKNDEGNANIQVEEYKRPAFYVEFEKIKGTYKVGDSVRVTGLAKAYAGNNIDQAVVKYRIVRQPRFLYPWLFSKWWQPPVKEMEIAHGELKSDGNGQFPLVFSAIPDRSIDRNLSPVFDYRIYADVTDLNGETRTGETSVAVSYQSLILKVNLPEQLPADSLQSIPVWAENMGGEFETATVKVKINRLQEEKRLIRNRYWDRPDQFVLPKDEYIRYFPHDEYDNETSNESWAKGETVVDLQGNVTADKQFVLTNWKGQPGFFVVEVSTRDRDGQEIKDKQFIELYNDNDNKLGSPQYLWTKEAIAVEPGEKTAIKIGTAADNLFVIQDIQKQTTVTNAAGPSRAGYSFLRISQEKKSIDFTASEADRGGFGISYLFVKHNRFYQTVQRINVPWTNKDLMVEYASFRDKTLPGSEEKWKLKITGYKHEKVAAEILASMYDASLDQFYPFEWNKPYLWTSNYNDNRWSGVQNFAPAVSNQKWVVNDNYKSFSKEYDQLISGNLEGGGDRMYKRLTMASAVGGQGVEGEKIIIRGVTSMAPAPMQEPGDTANQTRDLFIDATTVEKKEKQNEDQSATVQIRKNFNETAFFLPDLRTDSSGAIEFSFTIPEALTKWKFQALAHTKELAFGLSSKDIVTQKKLMVQPNAPRFLREGDHIEFSAKIVNLTDQEVTGQAELQLFDAATNQSVDGWFQNMFPNQYFTVAAGASEAVLFPLQVPYLFNKALTWRIVAKTTPAKDATPAQPSLSDGEEASLPVLTNKMLVTETLPLQMKGNGHKSYSFDKLLHAGGSETLEQHSLTVEYTSNPAWYAIQALPYLMEYPYDCAEQTWSRYYANALATMIANSSPRIKKIFEQWKTGDTATLLSNLQKNQELKSVLLEETPWVLQAKTEQEQRKNIGLLFDMVKMTGELTASLEKLKQLQLENGGFAWFKGGPDDRYITQYIVTGIGHLKKLKGINAAQAAKLDELLAVALPYLDKKIKADYDALIKNKTDFKKYTPGAIEIQYLYMRSFFSDHKVPSATAPVISYLQGRIQKTWVPQNKYLQGMIALSLSRNGDTKTPAAIIKSLKETAVDQPDNGMYWPRARNAWFWYDAPVETQALLIETFAEVAKDTIAVDNLKTWLLKNKQTNNWPSTKATAEACYALLLQGSNWLQEQPTVTIQAGKTIITPDQNPQEAGSGYFKQIITGEKITPDMGTISVEVGSQQKGNSHAPTWGAVYWQYFENLDKITAAATPLKLSKKLFVEKNTDHGPVLTPMNDGDAIKSGDKVKVRIELRADRDMEYVHLKDMRASSFEPVNVLSGYKWQGGLGYYETTKDASTNFFFGNLYKGTYVFEYTLFATQKGNFSNGVTTIQCMYAPEFTSHSEGIRVNVE